MKRANKIVVHHHIFPKEFVDAPFETTRAVANLMHQGVLDKYPDISYILSHGGGTIPYIARRLASIEYAQQGKRIPVFRTLYDFLVRTLQSLAGPDHIVFGTDLWIAKLAPVWVKNLHKYGDFTEEEYHYMSYVNGLELFPSLEKFYA